MALADAVQGATRTTQEITWSRDDGTAYDLTGATITGRMRNLTTGASRAISGTLEVTDADSGIFTWTYAAGDVATAGVYEVQFKATFSGGAYDLTLAASWLVAPAV